jgi:hypothetical protein
MSASELEIRMANVEPTGRVPWAVRALLERRSVDEMLPALKSMAGKSPAAVRAAADELKLTAQQRTAFSILVPFAEKLEAALAGPSEVPEAPRQPGGQAPRPAQPRDEPPAGNGP